MHKVKRCSYNEQKVTLVAANAAQVLGPNPRRVGIVLSPHAAEDVSFSFNPAVDISILGPINLQNGGTSPLIMCCCDWGTILQQPLFGYASGTITYYVAEILSDDALEY